MSTAISILTVFPDLYTPFIHTSLLRKAQENKTLSIDVVSYLSFVDSKIRIDAPTFGPSPGMLIKPEVVQKAIEQQESKHGQAVKIFFSPQGKKLNQKLLNTLAQKVLEKKHLLLATARYEGMDARVEQVYADEIVSIGDFVIMGGDLPAQVLLEGLTRLLPGVVGKPESVAYESFSGPFVDYPEYTQPVEWHGLKVPEVVRSGNHEKIRAWRMHQAAYKSVMQHFDWLRSYPLNQEQKQLAGPFIPPHYVVLMHDQVLLPNAQEGTTSITSLDIHDIARSATTYGLKRYFLVSPLADQQKIAGRLLEFWRTEVGIDYNPQRHKAVSLVKVVTSLDEVIGHIEQEEKKKPLIIATSARTNEGENVINYNQQDLIWSQERPVVLLLGTGQGLAPSVMKRADYILTPLEGFSDFNHLSVRSAAAIIFDRWLGINQKS